MVSDYYKWERTTNRVQDTSNTYVISKLMYPFLSSADGQHSLGLQSARYIQEHFTCVINGKQIHPEFSGSVAQKGWTKFEFELEQCVADIKTFEVETDCILSHGYSHGHSFINTIEFAFPGQEKSYTLDSDRKKILPRFKDS